MADERSRPYDDGDDSEQYEGPQIERDGEPEHSHIAVAEHANQGHEAKEDSAVSDGPDSGHRLRAPPVPTLQEIGEYHGGVGIEKEEERQLEIEDGAEGLFEPLHVPQTDQIEGQMHQIDMGHRARDHAPPFAVDHHSRVIYGEFLSIDFVVPDEPTNGTADDLDEHCHRDFADNVLAEWGVELHCESERFYVIQAVV